MLILIWQNRFISNEALGGGKKFYSTLREGRCSVNAELMLHTSTHITKVGNSSHFWISNYMDPISTDLFHKHNYLNYSPRYLNNILPINYSHRAFLKSSFAFLVMRNKLGCRKLKAGSKTVHTQGMFEWNPGLPCELYWESYSTLNRLTCRRWIRYAICFGLPH